MLYISGDGSSVFAIGKFDRDPQSRPYQVWIFPTNGSGPRVIFDGWKHSEAPLRFGLDLAVSYTGHYLLTSATSTDSFLHDRLIVIDTQKSETKIYDFPQYIFSWEEQKIFVGKSNDVALLFREKEKDSDYELGFFDVTTGKLRTTGFSLGRLSRYAISDDGKQLVSGFFFPQLTFWNLLSGESWPMDNGIKNPAREHSNAFRISSVRSEVYFPVGTSVLAFNTATKISRVLFSHPREQKGIHWIWAK